MIPLCVYIIDAALGKVWCFYLFFQKLTFLTHAYPRLPSFLFRMSQEILKSP